VKASLVFTKLPLVKVLYLYIIRIAMANKQPLKTTFDVNRVLRPIFTGGAVSIDSNAHILATTLGEDAVLTDPVSGKHLCDIEGVSGFPSSME
jgi:hypothetical protein